MGSSGRNGMKEREARHAEHVAEVGAGGHVDVLQRVGEGDPPLPDALDQDAQVLLQQDDVGRLLGDVHGRVDRDADVGRVQGRGVVDPVAHVADDVAGLLEGEEDRAPSGWARPRRRRRPRRPAGSGPRRSSGAISGPVRTPGPASPTSRPTCGGDEPVVPREDLQRDAEPPQLPDGRVDPGLRAGRGARGTRGTSCPPRGPSSGATRPRGRGRPRPACDTPGAELRVTALDLGPHRGEVHDLAPGRLGRRADLQDVRERPLGHQQVAAVAARPRRSAACGRSRRAPRRACGSRRGRRIGGRGWPRRSGWRTRPRTRR